MPKPTLIIIIDNLAKGGAEIMLVNLLAELKKKFEVILVTLTNNCAFEKKEIICDYQYSLGFKNKLSFLTCIFRLKRIIKKHKPEIIHAHLIYSSLVARIACPNTIPLLYSIHGELSKSDFNKSRILTLLEKSTIKNNHSLLAVSNVVLQDYEKTIKKTNRSFVLPNYISDNYLNQKIPSKNRDQVHTLKLIAVGNIKAAKNYQYLIESFSHLKDVPVTLDIYGNTDHPLYKELQSEIDRLKVPVFFKGAFSNVISKFHNYDLFVMSSKNEGFGIAVIEAMSCGLPVLVSDIPVMREITLQNALFFNLSNPHSFVEIIQQIFAGKNDLKNLSLKGISISKKYNKKEYSDKLLNIYNELKNEFPQ